MSSNQLESQVTAREQAIAIRRAAMDLLARREYARLEMRRRLLARFEAYNVVEQELGKLEQEGLLSDARFAESYVRYRSNAGFGPQRILLELREKGVRDELAGEAVNAKDPLWLQKALVVRNKKFGALPPEDAKGRAARARFLHYRGFSTEHIARLEAAAADSVV